MKKLVKDYRFEPALRRVYIADNFRDRAELSTESFLLITNVTTGDMIYIFNEPELGGVYEYDYLTLDYDTTSMSPTDKLQIFVDGTPEIAIRGDDGVHRGGSHKTPAYVAMEDLTSTFNSILKELRKMNIHLQIITDENITNRDLDGEI